MNILALDTCTESCSAALLYQDILYQQSQLTQRGHSDLILGMMDELFKQSNSTIADVDVMAFGRGPGSFTGVRVGIGVTQGIAFARDIPVVPVSTLAAVAQQAIDQFDAEHIAVAMDARMGEVYTANYKNEAGIAVLLGEEQVCPTEKFKAEGSHDWFGTGTGWAEYEVTLRNNFDGRLQQVVAEIYPTAVNIIKLAQQAISQGKLLPPEQALPVYLRDNIARKKGDQ